LLLWLHQLPLLLLLLHVWDLLHCHNRPSSSTSRSLQSSCCCSCN
jgi:hypothetical protein